MDAFENIRLTFTEGRFYLTLARPAALNALNRAMLRELQQALDLIEAQSEARVLLLSADGRGFSSGADLAAGKTPAGVPGFDAGAVLEEFYNPMIERISNLSIPIVAAVQGPVVGAGSMLALMADIVVAARSAYFLQAFVQAGLVPDCGGTWLLPRLVGKAKAVAMMMLAERISADTAYEWGLIYKVVDDGERAACARDIVDRLAVGPTRAFGLIRRGVTRAMQSTLQEALRLEREAQCEAGNTADFLEGIAAFREKRAPRFTGR